MNKLYYEYCKTYNLNKGNCDGFLDLVNDIYYSDEVQSLMQYEQHLNIDRLQHITSVSYLSYKICKHFGWNYEAAAKAATMHDLFYYDWRDGLNGKWHKLHGYKHPTYAAMNAAELCPNITKHEIDIIKRHMWPLTLLPPNSKEGLVVSLADKYSAALEVLYSVNGRFRKKFINDIAIIK